MRLRERLVQGRVNVRNARDEIYSKRFATARFVCVHNKRSPGAGLARSQDRKRDDLEYFYIELFRCSCSLPVCEGIKMGRMRNVPVRLYDVLSVAIISTVVSRRSFM